MTASKGVASKLLELWILVRTRVLTLGVFGLFLQGALFILVLLDSNVTLLLKRDAAMGHVPGITHDYVTIGAALVEFALGALMGWWGQAKKHLALSFWMAVAAGAGLLVLAFPYQNVLESSVELCGGEEVSGYSRALPYLEPDRWVTPRICMLVLTAVCCALARLSIWAHGLVYLDDHQPENGAYFYGILITIRLSLGLNGVSWLTPGSTTNTWWYAHISLCMLTLMFGILFTLFPKRMEQHKLIDDDLINTGFLATTGRVVRNKTVIIQTIALSFLSAAVYSFVRFDHEFVQAQFHIETERPDPRASRSVTDLFRSLVIIFFVMIFRTRFSGRRSDGVKATTAARVGGVVAFCIAVPFVVLSLLRCDVGEIAGSSLNYVQPVCSMPCGCASESYGFSPVCALNTSTTYFSPCHAGCRSYEDLNGFLLFEECACGGGRAARGACSLDACSFVFNVYQIVYALILALAGGAMMMQGMVLLRAVLTVDKGVATGGAYGVIALLSHLIFMLYMLISHLSCAYSYNGGCLLHEPSLWTMAVLSAGLSVVSGVLSLLASRVARGLMSHP